MYNKYNTAEINGKFFDKIIVDTSSAMNPHFQTWLFAALPNLIRQNKRISIPQATMIELRKISSSNTENSNKADYAIKFINEMVSNEFLEFEGNPNSTETSNSYIIQQVMKIKVEKKKILVITQNYKLALDVLTTNRIQSSFSPAANVQRINTFSELENFDLSMRPSKVTSKQRHYPLASELVKRFKI